MLPVALGEELRGPPKHIPQKQRHGDAAKFRYSGTISRQWDRALEGIAAETGGHAFFPRSANGFCGGLSPHRVTFAPSIQFGLCGACARRR